MGKKSKKIAVEGSRNELNVSPFGALGSIGLTENSLLPNLLEVEKTQELSEQKKKRRGRVDVLRQRSAGSGGWSTIAKNFVGISVEEKNSLKKTMQKRCGAGGTLKNGNIEIQGDKREEMRDILESAGFRVVFAGG
tara:strand:+ start:201 stop:608 length:408 start_codon:yes stop_codon:yes gene_type:complete